MSSAANLYNSVISDVITSVRESFLDESVDEQVLQELKQIWTQKLDASRTVEPTRASGQQAMLDAKMAAVAPSARPGQRTASRPMAPVAGTSPPTASSMPASASGQQLVITDPNRLVPVQITIPAQPGNAASQPRALTVHVPAHALQQQSATSALLQQVLTQAITQALQLPESHAATFLQIELNKAFRIN